MKRRTIGIVTDLYECIGITGEGVQKGNYILKVLRSLGCQFFNFSPEYPDEQVPMDSDGDILPNAGLFSSFLIPSADAIEGAIEGDAHFSFTQEALLFNIDQNVLTSDLNRLEASAVRQIDFFKLIVAPFRPQLATIDEFGENGMSEKVVAKRRLTELSWYNVFGPAYCNQFGKQFFLNAPAWQVEDLGEFGVAVRATERLSMWLKKPDEALIQYFSSQFPKIKPYRARRS